MTSRPPFAMAVEMLLDSDGAIALQHNPANNCIDFITHDGNAACILLKLAPHEAEALLLALQLELNLLNRRTHVL